MELASYKASTRWFLKSSEWDFAIAEFQQNAYKLIKSRLDGLFFEQVNKFYYRMATETDAMFFLRNLYYKKPNFQEKKKPRLNVWPSFSDFEDFGDHRPLDRDASARHHNREERSFLGYSIHAKEDNNDLPHIRFWDRRYLGCQIEGHIFIEPACKTLIFGNTQNTSANLLEKRIPNLIREDSIRENQWKQAITEFKTNGYRLLEDSDGFRIFYYRTDTINNARNLLSEFSRPSDEDISKYYRHNNCCLILRHFDRVEASTVRYAIQPIRSRIHNLPYLFFEDMRLWDPPPQWFGNKLHRLKLWIFIYYENHPNPKK